ncbi:hypothetical protein [Arcanobacterium ihumii]|uniref:hypothetical protein n=1 Tax=Arcanobacterium ihumii TaxID=2138162 RepID=UPI000F526394|nr:hypothetical protein [Arcanobacterium ihumii]
MSPAQVSNQQRKLTLMGGGAAGAESNCRNARMGRNHHFAVASIGGRSGIPTQKQAPAKPSMSSRAQTVTCLFKRMGMRGVSTAAMPATSATGSAPRVAVDDQGRV